MNVCNDRFEHPGLQQATHQVTTALPTLIKFGGNGDLTYNLIHPLLDLSISLHFPAVSLPSTPPGPPGQH